MIDVYAHVVPPRYLQRVERLLELSAADEAKVFAGNAQRLLRLP